MKKCDIYLYGMIVLSNIHRLAGSYPEADSYAEIEESYIVPGGETGNSALILANLGYNVLVDGPYTGYKTRKPLLDFYSKYKIDCSNLYYDQEFEGVQDLVLIDQKTRTVFGKFANYFSNGKKKWNEPDREAIAEAKIVAIDPFFAEESIRTAEYCKELDKDYVTIDCNPTDMIHKNAAATIISNEYIRNNFAEVELEELHREYTDNIDGLVIFTSGSKEILYGRKDESIHSILPYQVEVKSTLGAGDTFRAGVVYGLLNCLSDEETVKFAAATAALVCTRFPMAFNPPDLEEIKGLVNE